MTEMYAMSNVKLEFKIQIDTTSALYPKTASKHWFISFFIRLLADHAVTYLSVKVEKGRETSQYK
jgi:hypothetical protein